MEKRKAGENERRKAREKILIKEEGKRSKSVKRKRNR